MYDFDVQHNRSHWIQLNALPEAYIYVYFFGVHLFFRCFPSHSSMCYLYLFILHRFFFENNNTTT